MILTDSTVYGGRKSYNDLVRLLSTNCSFEIIQMQVGNTKYNVLVPRHLVNLIRPNGYIMIETTSRVTPQDYMKAQMRGQCITSRTKVGYEQRMYHIVGQHDPRPYKVMMITQN